MGKYTIAAPDQERIDNAFVYHAPRGDQPERYVLLRSEAKKLAELISANVPPGRERALALTKLEEAVFWANAGIARGEV